MSNGTATVNARIVEIVERSPHGIAAGIARLIADGVYAPGDRLPTVRDVALALGVSPATVSGAWRRLATAGLIESRGRSGSFVRTAPRAWLPRSYHGYEAPSAVRFDLSLGIPDAALLPEFGPSLARVASGLAAVAADSSRYQAKPDVPELHDLLREAWPAPVESLTVVNGALDGIDRAIAALTGFGDRIAIDTPSFPPLLELAERAGLEVVPMAMDAHGVVPAALSAALATRPAVVLLQPRAHNPTGVSMSPERAEQLASVLRRARHADRTVVVEDDHSAGVAGAPEVTLATWLPERVLHIRSFSKSHGPDLRIGALGGPRELVDRVVARRLLGPGWTSRMLQRLLFDLLTHADSVATVARAKSIYAARSASFTAALAARGVEIERADGINAWVPLAAERDALVQLTAAGIRVAPGTPFQAAAPAGTTAAAPHARVTFATLDDAAITAVADALAATAPTPAG